MAGTKEFYDLSKEYAESMFGCTLEELDLWEAGKCIRCELPLSEEETGFCNSCFEKEEEPLAA